MNDKRVRIVQISDTHLFHDKKRELLSVKTEDSFKAILDMLNKENPHPDLILFTGDLSQDGSQNSYERLADEISQLNIPTYCLPGNHDNVSVMEKVYPRGQVSTKKQIILNGWQLILLNSQKPGAVAGYLNNQELDFLKQCLQRHPEHRAIIAFHHQPIPVGSKWLDEFGLTNSEVFWETVKSFPQAQIILSGHVHQEFVGEKYHLKYWSAPATSVQFKRDTIDFALENLNQGYRWIELHENGELKTWVKRLDHYVGKFDADAKGYK